MASSKRCSLISLINLLSSRLLDSVNCGSLVDLLLLDCALSVIVFCLEPCHRFDSLTSKA
ncbi:hypothetical protein Bca101_028839 [Brassica carinata]